MEEVITVEEAAKRLKKDKTYIINAIEQGLMPGIVLRGKDGSGRANVCIPRLAFESFMTQWHTSPSDKLVHALMEVINKGR